MTYAEYTEISTHLAESFGTWARDLMLATAAEPDVHDAHVAILREEDVDALVESLEPVLTDEEAAEALTELESAAGITWGAPLAAPREED